MKKQKKKRKIFFVILFIILLPIILIELIFKSLFRLIKRNKSKKARFGDKEFYESLSIEKVDIMNGIEFEKFLSRLFIYKGYLVSETARTGDFGADLLLKKDGRVIVVQAKRYNGNVGAKALQEIFSAKHHYKADDMMVICNSYFTKQAQIMSEEQNIELIDRDELIDLINEVREDLKQNMTSELQKSVDEENNDCGIYDNFKYRI